MRQQPDEFFKRIVAAKNHMVETTAHESQLQPSEISTTSSNKNLLLSELLSLAVLGVGSISLLQISDPPSSPTLLP